MKNIVFIFILVYSMAFSQNKFTIYFETNSHQLLNSELNRLDDFLKNKELKITKIIGYCDYRATNKHNDTLALNRANFIYHIIEKTTSQKQIEIEVKGEKFKQNSNLALNRKVEIYYEKVPTKKIEKEEVKKEPNSFVDRVSNAKVGDKLVLKNLYFYNRSGVFRPESRPVLEELLAVMKNYPKLKIEIQGHICCQLGTDVEDTAKVRALAVYNYLIEKGIEVKRLTYKSFGSTKPIYKIPERNEEERNENRRVEIQIIEN